VSLGPSAVPQFISDLLEAFWADSVYVEYLIILHSQYVGSRIKASVAEILSGTRSNSIDSPPVDWLGSEGIDCIDRFLEGLETVFSSFTGATFNPMFRSIPQAL